jgi:tRNA ligase
LSDRNNHLKQHRQQLRDAVRDPSVRLLALNWGVVDKPPAIVHRICSDRVIRRGDNHQTLRVETPASSSSTAAATKKHEEVLWMFLNTFEELADGEVDEVIDIPLDSDLEAAVRQVVIACVEIIGMPQPSEEKIQEALDAVEAYTVSSKSKHVKEDRGKAKPQARYYALLPEVDISSLLEHHLSGDTVPEAIKKFWTYLKSEKRVVKIPHVTIVHRNSLSGNSADEESKELWGRCEGLYAMSHSPFFRGKLGSVLCDPVVGVMALTFDDLGLDAMQQIDGEGQEAQTFVSTLSHSVREKLHITIGTKGETKPVEAGEMVKRWRAYERDNIKEFKLEDVFARGRVQGMQG